LNILVIGAHADDEVVGMGATIKKLSKNNKIFLCIITDGTTAQYDDKKMIKVRRDACMKSSKLLGISKVKFLDFPDMMDGRISQLEINKELEKIISEVLSKNQDKLTQYKSGKVKLFGYFVGEVMKVSKGKANPQLVNEILKTKLK